MKMDVFDECMWLLNCPEESGSESPIDVLTDHDFNIYEKFQNPLLREINHNLLTKETREGKRDMLKYYISEFYEVQLMFLRHMYLSETKCSGYGLDWRYYSKEENCDIKATKWECYILCAWELFELIFDDLQICAITYSIDFFSLCTELNFRSDTFDGGVTIEYDINTYYSQNNLPYMGLNEYDPNRPWNSQEVIPVGFKSKPCNLKSSLDEKTLKQYGFYNLPQVALLSKDSQETLTQDLISNDVPYIIAMFDALGFIKVIKKENFNTSEELYGLLAEICNTTKRTVKGNILVLNDKSKENKDRYTSHKFKKQVQIDFNRLK